MDRNDILYVKDSGCLSSFLEGKDNNYNLVRFLAATAVLIAHSYVLVDGNDSREPFNSVGLSLGSLSVNIFFIISGFLICASFYRSSSILSYVVARLVRIFPALFFVLFLTVFFLGPIVTSVGLLDYLISKESFLYLAKNSSLLFGVYHYLPGVFENNPYPKAVNGSLWTLPFELRMYVLVAILSYFTLKLSILKDYKNRSIYFFILALLGVLGWSYDIFVTHENSRFWKLYTAFFVGAAFYCSAKHIKMSAWISMLFMTLLATVVAASWLNFLNGKVMLLMLTLILPYLILYFVYCVAGAILNFNRLGDYSYGMYVYAFPVQQTIVFSIPDCTVMEMIVFSFLITLVFSIISWKLIEEKALSKKKSLMYWLTNFRNRGS